MNIEDSLLRDEQERTLTWAIEKLEKDGSEIDSHISQASGELSQIQEQLDKVHGLLEDLQDQRSAVDRKIEMANQRMATLDTQPVRPTSRIPDPYPEKSQPAEPRIEQEFNGTPSPLPEPSTGIQSQESGSSYHTVNIRCRGTTLDLLRQIHLHTGVSEDTIMENAISAVAQAIEKNDFRMHFPLSVKLVQYEA